MDKAKVEQFKTLLNLVDNSLTKKDFLKAFADVVAFVKKIENNTKEADNARNEALQRATRALDERTLTGLSDIQGKVASLSDELRSMCASKMQEMDKCMSEVEDGEDADEEKIVEDVLERIQIPTVEEFVAEIPKYGAKVRDSLEYLKDNDRLDKSAIKGIEKLEDEIKNIKSIKVSHGGGGGRGIQLKIDGTKKGLVQELNLIAGTGITLSYSQAYGRNDVTITATGTASLSPIAVTGTIDDSNTSFTADSAPNIVIVNGSAYRNGKGATIVGTAITLDNPVGVGGDIYCL